MLIICNGTFKSGSSWLHAIILDILEMKSIKITKIPIAYNPNIKSPTRILEKNLDLFIKNEDYCNCNYITKAHFFNKKTLSNAYAKEVRFIFINRDIKDAIVSHFFHFNNYRKTKYSFETYFNLVGAFKAYEMYLFNKRCKQNFPLELFLTFEGLKSDFSASVRSLCEILGLENISAMDLEKIRTKTSLEKMKDAAKKGENKYYPELGNKSHKLFRKGNIGDWKEYFSEKQLAVIDKIVKGYAPRYIRFGYFMFFTLRRKIGI